MGIKTEYRDHFSFGHPICLFKNDLFELEKMLIENPETDLINIDINFNQTNIYVNSFKELFTFTNLPKSINNLDISLQRRDKKSIINNSHGIRLFLSSGASCSIYSIDETWVLGKKSKIKSFINSRKPWYSILKNIVVIYPTISMLLIFYCVHLFNKKDYNGIIIPLFCSLIILNIFTSIMNGKLFPGVKIYLQDKPKYDFGFNELCALIGALASLAAFAQVLRDLFK